MADIEKQLAAYSGDDSEETRKKRQELQKQLNDAQQQLQETEWDRYISETNQMLDDMKTDYEKYLNDQTESITKVMMDMIPYINDNKTAIQNGLNEIKTEYGITTQHFEDFASKQDDILSVFTHGDFASKLTGIHDVIDDFKKQMSKVTDTSTNGILGIIEDQSKDVKAIGKALSVDYSDNNPNKPKNNGGNNTDSSKGSGEKLEDSLYGANDGTWKKDAKGDWYQYGDGSYAKNEYIDGYWLNSEGYWDSSWDGSWKHNDKGYWWEYSDGSFPKNEWLKIDGDWYYFDSEGYMVTGKQTIGGKSYTFGSNGDWLGYAKGTKSSPRDQLAWTQENASELIYRTSDGAMLTPLNRGDMVFTHDMSQRLWEIAKGNIPTTVGLTVPNVGSSNVRNVTSNNNITIELPNVENYNDFKREMKQDKELEKFWQEITIGQAMGNNTLKKNRY